jgi:2-aminoethylphosphonate-pyruvate transaminase
MLGDDLCHREAEFTTLQSGIRDKLLAVYRLDDASWAAALMTGSGTAAVEAMITSLLPSDGKLLIIENGVYGERMTRIAQQYGIACAVTHHAWDAPIDVGQVARQLDNDRAVTHVAVVHHETTTGRLNALAPLAAVCRDHEVQILLDGVSSFGAEDIEFDGWPLAACAATANKCLHGVPGTCFVMLKRAVLETAGPRSVYLDLPTYIAAQDAGGTPFTQSVQTFYALDAALDELGESGGVAARRALYTQRMRTVRDHLAGLGVRPLLGPNDCSCVLHAYELPNAVDYPQLHDGLKDRGFVIYAGQGEFAARLFRISMMGAITPADVDRLNTAFTEVLQR